MIGVFDSGHGGLTVLEGLQTALPDQGFLYLGDHGNAPYGNRSPDDILRLTIDAVDSLFSMGCPLVILACNTAAASALRRLQQEWLPGAHPDKRVLGVLVPMVEAITGMPWMAEIPASRHAGQARTIGVFGTRQTVASEAYPREIHKRAPEVTVVQQACPHLAGMIEDGADRAEIRRAVHGYVGDLMAQLSDRPPQAVMLGCTHYPLVTDLFAEALPPGVETLSQPDLTARSLKAYLERHPEFSAPFAPTQFFTTGDAARVTALARRFWGREVTFQAAPR